MTWQDDFYASLNDDAGFSASVKSLSIEYHASAVIPFATYQLISAVGTNDLDGHSPEGERRIQLNIWAKDPTIANSIAKQAITAVNGSLDVHNITERSLGRDDEDFGYSIDFSIWFQEP